MDTKQDHCAREAEGWTRFSAAVHRIPPDRWAEPGVLPDWTVNEMLWHVAGWMDDCSDDLDAIAAGTFVDSNETDEQTDQRNASFAAAARGMDADAVWAGLLAARERVLDRWNALPEVTQDAVDSFTGETYEHYPEHLPELDAFTP
jgi:hypothetical protein